MQTYCCSSAEGCFNNTTCSGLLQCVSTACQTAATEAELLACADAQCAPYASAKTTMMSYLNCMNTSCTTACGA
jgi:hypothetical protein